MREANSAYLLLLGCLTYHGCYDSICQSVRQGLGKLEVEELLVDQFMYPCDLLQCEGCSGACLVLSLSAKLLEHLFSMLIEQIRTTLYKRFLHCRHDKGEDFGHNSKDDGCQ